MILVGSEFSREEYYSRIKWLVLGRGVLAAFLCGSLVLVQSRFPIYHFPTAYLFYFGSAVALLTVVYWYLLRRFANLPLLAYLQVSGDILLISWLVYLTGGIDSGLSILYHVTIISASIILYRKGGLFSASLASILYGTMLDMQYYSVLGFSRSQSFTPSQVLYLLFINILSFYIVAVLSSYVSERLRKTRQELREKSIDFEDLRVMQDHILRSVGSGIVTMDMSGEITSWNNAAELITGYPFEEIRGRWKSVFGDSIKGLFGQTDELKDRPVRFEGRIPKRNGSRAILGFTASLLKDDRNAVRGIILTFQDITRLIEMEEQMRRQERLATVGSLAAGIAHEIRNPLAALSGSIQMLQGELDLKGENRHLMDIVLRETDRLNTIITEFLEYARPRTLSRQKVFLASLVDETIALFRNSRNYRDGVRVTTRIAAMIAVAGDPRRLRQVFWNLLINAAQAIADRGEIAIAADRGTGADEEHVVIRFSDTGAGIPLEHLDNIFDPFFTTKSDGTGLGLAIVYRIIEDHGGTITVRSEPGEGTTFTILLPLEEAVGPADGPAPPVLSQGGTER